jgi:coatomer subunit delta
VILVSTGSYPTVASHSGEWQLNPSSHRLEWTTPLVKAEDRSGSLEFSINSSDVNAFFPVKVSFAGLGNTVGVRVASVSRVDNGEDVVFSEDASFNTDNYLVV